MTIKNSEFKTGVGGHFQKTVWTLLLTVCWTSRRFFMSKNSYLTWTSLFMGSGSISCLLDPFICGQTLRLLPYLRNYKQCCYEHYSMCTFSNYCFVFSDMYPGVALLGNMVVLFLVFWQTSLLFSTVAAPIYIRTNSVWGLPFLHILANICFLCSFWW